jgi:hypothetical protein
MKVHLAGKRHAADELQHAVADRLNRLAADTHVVDLWVCFRANLCEAENEKNFYPNWESNYDSSLA